MCTADTPRYTMLRSGRRKLMIPNSTFLTREFVIVEDEGVVNGAADHAEHRYVNGNAAKGTPVTAE